MVSSDFNSISNILQMNASADLIRTTAKTYAITAPLMINTEGSNYANAVNSLANELANSIQSTNYNEEMDYDQDGAVSIQEKLQYYSEQVSERFNQINNSSEYPKNFDLRNVDYSQYEMQGYNNLQAMLQYSAYLRSFQAKNLFTQIASNLVVRV